MKRIIVVAVCITVVPSLAAQEWTRFRGPNGSGISEATTIPIRWSDSDYNWKVRLPGVGHSSPVVWGERIFLTSGDEESGNRTLVCINSEGHQEWTRQFEAKTHRKHKLNSFASATPAVDAKRVYVCWGTPDEFVVGAIGHDGSEVWRRDFGGFKSGHGDGVSPIVFEDLVVISLQHNGDSAFLGLDCDSGETRWQVGTESKGNWSTPCIFRRTDDVAELVFTNWTDGITSIDPKSGRVLWQADVFDKGHVESSISSPIVAGDLVLGTSGWMGVRQEVIAIRPGKLGPHNGEPSRVYCIDRGAPLCTTPLAKDDLLFLWSDQGIVTCADVATGKVHWRKRIGGAFYSSPIAVGDAVYNISTAGEVIVVQAADEFKELARNQLGETCHATPAVSNGVMYLRTVSRLFSLGGVNSQ